jgi:putative DNA primase/helicase
MRGDPLIAIDNCERPLEGDLINQALTQTWVNLRILGQSQAIKARCASLITATGNNLTLKGDVTRRSLVSRLDPKCERPELKQFDYDPIFDAKENRGHLVADALTILRAYQCAGRPNPPPPLQGFVEWSNTIRASLIWLGEADPVKSMDRLRETDPVLANLKTVLTAWRDEFGDASTTTNDVVAAAANATQATPEPGTLDRLRDALLVVAGRGGKIEIRLLGQWLGKNVDRVVDLGGGDLVVLEKAGLLHGVQQWRVVSQEHEQQGDFGFSEGGLGGLGGTVQATQAKMSARVI